MKRFIKHLFYALTLIGLVTASACKKEEDDHDHDHDHMHYGNAVVKVDHLFGMNMSAFSLGTTYVHPMSGDTLNFSKFRYYLSNIRLKSADGSWFTRPESYYLLDASVPSSLSLNIDSIPEGSYTDMEITFGVDSTRNVSGAQSGALSTTNDMFWSWTTGYIMLKAEGSSPQAGSGGFSYHLGGFSGVNNIVNAKSFSFGATPLIVGEGSTSTITMQANPARLFHTFGSVSNGAVIHMPGTNAKTMATDFWDWFRFDHLHNP
jgi:hypothetical protein